MGYGLGAFLLAVGLVLALAVTDSISGVDLTTVGWILTAVGVLCLALTAMTANRSRGMHSVARTQTADGQTAVTERHTEI